MIEISAQPKLIALVGPTASGKTDLAVKVAKKFGLVELLSIDSMTIYRSMNVGTAKPKPSELDGVAYHMVDLVQPWESYSLSQFQDKAKQVISEVRSRGNLPLLVGGTGLYYQALIDDFTIPSQWPSIREELEAISLTDSGLNKLYQQLLRLDPVAASKMEPTNSRRIVRALEVTLGSGKPFSQHGPGLFENIKNHQVAVVGIDLPRAELYARIESRLDAQLRNGWLEETGNLLADAHGLSRTAKQALGYRELIQVLQGHLSLEEARSTILARTKRLAKRQLAWFKRDQRIAWFGEIDQARTALESIVAEDLKV